MASRDNNQKLKDKFGKACNVKSEQIACSGCLSDKKFVSCQACRIRACIEERGLEGCHCCDDFPCKQINEFPVPIGKKVILRSIPERKKLGNQKWAESEKIVTFALTSEEYCKIKRLMENSVISKAIVIEIKVIWIYLSIVYQ